MISTKRFVYRYWKERTRRWLVQKVIEKEGKKRDELVAPVKVIVFRLEVVTGFQNISESRCEVR